MKRKTEDTDAILDRAMNEIHNEKIDSAIIEGAAKRVWAKLSTESASAAPVQAVASSSIEHIHGCSDFQSLMPAYLRGELQDARAMLLKDHTHECIPCRRALKLAREGKVAATVATPAARTISKIQPVQPVWKWAIAATFFVGFGLLIWPLLQFGQNVQATVEVVNGTVYRVSDSDLRAIGAGEAIQRGEKIRTGKDATAVVKLDDGSLVEMKDRSEFSLSRNSDGTTIELERGNVIVQAAKQGAHHLYVRTDESVTTVTGTIFSVNHGTKGTRVSVVEGEVHVNYAGKEDVLKPGDQTTTQVSLEKVPVKTEVAWSRDAARYGELLNQFAGMQKDLNQVQQPDVRYSTRLLDSVPEGTVLYAALPNLSATLTESHRIMQERIRQNAALREWWEKENGKGNAELSQIIERVRQFGEQLGDELAISAEMDSEGKPSAPLVLATLKNPAGFRPFLDQQIATFAAEQKGAPKVRIIDDPQSATQAAQPDGKMPEELLIWINGDIVAAAPELAQLQRVSATLKNSGANKFKTSSFYARIADVYREGAGLIVAADLEKIVTHALKQEIKGDDSEQRMEGYKKLGLLDLKHFIVEQKEKTGKTQSRAMLTFSQTRRGVASWLAAPGPMGALEFISPDANVTAAFVVKEPTALVDDLLGFIETTKPGLRQQLNQLQTTHGINVRNDIAAPLGGEFAFAIDGPVLPTPSWKVVVEVYDSAKLQQTLERMVTEINKYAAKDGKGGLQWERAEIGGRTFYTLKSVDFGLEFNYAYVNGYMVAGPSRALVTQAVRYRDSGYTLLTAPRFKAALPADGNTNFSAILYHNLAPLVQPLADRMKGTAQNLPQEQQQALSSLADSAPTLAYAYAQDDRVIFAADTEGGPFGLSPATLLGMPTSFGLQHILMEGMNEKPSGQQQKK
ncbi:MAG: FecR domain-containing protein [Pyrinomonadaceae bacterium]|nr:FecR domain-containing protein [Pyrinomonadaceae bacterium]